MYIQVQNRLQFICELNTSHWMTEVYGSLFIQSIIQTIKKNLELSKLVNPLVQESIEKSPYNHTYDWQQHMKVSAWEIEWCNIHKEDLLIL